MRAVNFIEASAFYHLQKMEETLHQLGKANRIICAGHRFLLSQNKKIDTIYPNSNYVEPAVRVS